MFSRLDTFRLNVSWSVFNLECVLCVITHWFSKSRTLKNRVRLFHALIFQNHALYLWQCVFFFDTMKFKYIISIYVNIEYLEFSSISINFTTCYHFIYAEMDCSDWNSKNCSLNEDHNFEFETFQTRKSFLVTTDKDCNFISVVIFVFSDLFMD